MRVNFIKKYEILVITKNANFALKIKFEKENVDYLRRKF